MITIPILVFYFFLIAGIVCLGIYLFAQKRNPSRLLILGGLIGLGAAAFLWFSPIIYLAK